jgi:menaquinone-dependent protoporphyrinogen oxidase
LRNIIIYATKHGFTERCVSKLKENLTGETTLYKAGSNQGTVNLDQYDNAIIGGPVYVSKMRPELVKFVKENQNKLLSKNLFLFACSGDIEADYIKESLPGEIYDKAQHNAHFGAELRYKSLGFVEGIIIRLMGKKEYSRMDSDAIKEMADKINRVAVTN